MDWMINTNTKSNLHENFLLDVFVITLIREQRNYFITMIYKYYYYHHCHSHCDYILGLIIELYSRLEVGVMPVRCVETSSRLEQINHFI